MKKYNEKYGKKKSQKVKLGSSVNKAKNYEKLPK